VDKKKLDLIEGLKLVQQQGSSLFVDNATSSEKALIALYVISNLIAKNLKPFNEKFVKEYLIAESFRNSVTLEEASRIPLSDKTVKSRIDDITSSLENKNLY